jgi:hypothetical protein
LFIRPEGIDPPPCGIAACFPNTDFTCEPLQGDLRGCVLGAQNLNWLDRAAIIIAELAWVLIASATASKQLFVDLAD